MGDGSRSWGAAWGWLIAALIALPYLIFSLVLLLNSIGNATGTVWLPSFPSAYYQLKTLLELPLQPYFALFDGYRNSPTTSYMQYTFASRGPVVCLMLGVIATAAIRLIRGRGGRIAQAAHARDAVSPAHAAHAARTHPAPAGTTARPSGSEASV